LKKSYNKKSGYQYTINILNFTKEFFGLKECVALQNKRACEKALISFQTNVGKQSDFFLENNTKLCSLLLI